MSLAARAYHACRFASVVPVPPARSESAADLLPLDEFSRLVESIYQGPLESPPWKGFLETLRTRLAASFTTLILRPASPEHPSVAIHAGASRVDSVDLYNSRFFELDPFVDLPHDQVVTAAEIVGDRAWLDSVIYREYLQPLDIRHILGADLRPLNDGGDCRLRVSRPHAQPPFGEADKALCRLVLPHLRQSVRLWSRVDQIDTERNLFAGAVERMQVGTVTLDEAGAILSINAEAQAILDQKDGIRLVGGALKADYHEEQALLARLTAAALCGAQLAGPKVVEAVSITRPSGRDKLSVLVRTVSADDWSDAWQRPKVAVFLRDPEHKAQGSGDVIRHLFGLTRAEASLALQLVNGLTLDDAAEQLGIRRNTARAQLRTTFSKMGVTRQTELVRLVLKSVVQLG